MEESMEVFGTESTTSTAATESAEAVTQATETAETTVGSDETTAGEGTTPPDGAEDGTAQGSADTAAFVLPVRFCHESRELSLEEAQSYAQKGMQLDSITPTLDKIRTMAAAQNITMNDMVENLWSAFERQNRQEILERVGGNEEAADALMEKKRTEWNAAFENAKTAEKNAEKSERETLENRLMQGYTEVREAFPHEYPEFKNIPQAVVNDAIKNNRGLLDALLRYRHKEGAKVEQNKQAQERAATASAGSQSDKPTGNPTIESIEQAFLSALGR